MNRRFSDPDMFPAIADFLRERKQLKTLHLSVPDEHVQRAVGFDASIWGVLPSLVALKSLSITYPIDLSPGLASWLVPRSVLALNLDYEALPMRDPVQFLNVCLSLPVSCFDADEALSNFGSACPHRYAI